jgi:hypothetical protein
MRGSSFPWWLHVVVCALLAVPFIGCEDDDTSIDEVSDYQSVERGDTKPVATAETAETVTDLSVSPATATLAGDGDMASFTAAGGTAPYTWSVTDVFRGSIVDSGGAGAAYQRSAAGDNTVVVKDSKGKKAYAVITQP